MSHSLSRHASVPVPKAFNEGSTSSTNATGLIDDLAERELVSFGYKVLGLVTVWSIGALILSQYRHAKRFPVVEKPGLASSARFHALRLEPHVEIKAAIEKFVKDNNIAAGSIVSCVGSTERAHLRLSNARAGESGSFLDLDRPCEIVSLSGTVSANGMHLHISLGDEVGKVFGGHLATATVNTTCELVIAEYETLVFRRLFDPKTGYGELSVQKTSEESSLL